MNYVVTMATKEEIQPSQFGRRNSNYGSRRINFENVIIYQRWELANQNICNIKITKLANMWEETDVFVKNWEGSIPKSVAIATVKSS